MSYSKLFSSIVHSSLWTEEDHVRLLFVTLLAIADREGFVYGSRGGLERLANIELEYDRNPWEVLMDPDPDSSDLMRNPEYEGRRIEQVPGGFRILNYSYYRSLRNEDDRREQNREAQKTFRATHRSVKRKSAKENHRNSRIGYVYYATDGRHIKIGYSTNPWSRMQELKVGCPTIRLLAVERAPESKEGERHTLFSEYRVVGEWFKNEPSISAHIESLLRNVSQDKPSANQVSQDKQSPSASASAYLEDLKKNPLHALIDIDRELEKAGQWCKKKNRKLTQRFFNNWLKNADRSIPMPKAKSQPMAPVNDTPPDEREKILAAGRAAIGKLSQQFKMP